ncbi:AMP-binding protein [Bacillus cereus]
MKKQQLTYRELNERANQLAHHLQKCGIGTESLVGLCFDRSVEMVVGLMGIWKAGAAYVPLDPSNPESRLRYILEDTDIQVLVTNEVLVGWIPKEIKVVCLDRDQAMISRESKLSPTCEVTGGKLSVCYLHFWFDRESKGGFSTAPFCNKPILWFTKRSFLT